jgi:hypothetical protein
LSARRRNALLEALERFRGLDPNATLLETLAFLYTCENEGLSISELAIVCRTSLASASRTARRLAGEARGPGPATPLVSVRTRAEAGAARTLHLTVEGAALRDLFDALIAEAAPILTRPAGSGGAR